MESRNSRDGNDIERLLDAALKVFAVTILCASFAYFGANLACALFAR